MPITNLRLVKYDEKAADLFNGPPPELAQHPLFGAGGARVGLMTAEAPRFEVSNAGGNEGLKQRLGSMGLHFEQTHGSYGGPENSFIIHGPTRAQLHQLGKEFGQEAVVYGEGGKHELHYTAGPNAGQFHPSLPVVRYSQAQPEDYYTHVPGHGYATLHFDFDKLHPYTPEAGDQAVKKTDMPARPTHHRMNFRRTVGHGVLLTAAEHEHLQGFLKSEAVTVDDIKKFLVEALREVLKKHEK